MSPDAQHLILKHVVAMSLKALWQLVCYSVTQVQVRCKQGMAQSLSHSWPQLLTLHVNDSSSGASVIAVLVQGHMPHLQFLKLICNSQQQCSCLSKVTGLYWLSQLVKHS